MRTSEILLHPRLTAAPHPMYSARAGPLNLLGPKRVRHPAVRFDDLPSIAAILLSHNHYDHCDRRTLRMLGERFDPLVVTPLGTARSSGRVASAESRSWTGGRNRRRRRCQSRSRRLITSPREVHSIETVPFGAGSSSRSGERACSSPAIPRMRPSFARSASGSAASTSRCCPSAPTSRDGSCGPCT
jgi:Beta-lactamase superfamily domain